MKKKYPTWDKVQKAKVSQVAGAIRSGGLARIKAKRIQTILNQIKEKYGKLNLDFLAQWQISKARKELESLPGVGPKTASCVLLFSLGKPVLPVDTHVHRLSQRLGFIGKKVNADKAQEILEELIEPKERYAFHISLIQHGRQVCKSFKPHCAGCVILEYCPYGQQSMKL